MKINHSAKEAEISMDQRDPSEVKVKIQVKHFLLSIFFVFLFIFGMVIYYSTSNISAQKVFSCVLIFCSTGLFTYNICETILWSYRSRKFEGFFGQKPPDVPGGGDNWKIMKILQPIVDYVLSSTAKDLQDAYNDENMWLDKNPSNLFGLHERANTVAEKSAKVNTEKKFFWDRRDLAYEYGFEVYNSYQDYISTPISKKNKKAIK